MMDSPMTIQLFKIRRALLIPFGINVLLLLTLLGLSLFFKGSAVERIVLLLITLPTAVLFLEATNRSVTITEQGLRIRKFLRNKEVFWGDISHVGCLIIRRKVYLLITSTKGFHILSNAYDDYSALISRISENCGPEKTEEDVRALTGKPLNNLADLISMWFAVAAITVMVLLKLSPC